MESKGMSTGAKIGIGVAILIASGAAAYFMLGKKDDKKGKGDGTGIGGADDATNGGKKGKKGMQDSSNGSVGSSAPITAANATPGEGTAIAYIAPGSGNGKGNDYSDMSSIQVRTLDPLFTTGDQVKITHPAYNGTYTVSGVDPQPGGTSTFAYIKGLPFVDTGEMNPNGEGKIDTRTGGTIEVIGQETTAADAPNLPNETADSSGNAPAFLPTPSGGSPSSTDTSSNPSTMAGTGSANDSGSSFSNASGKKKGKKHIRFFSKTEATVRKKRHKEGKKSGLKGAALRSFIRKGGSKKNGFDGLDADGDGQDSFAIEMMTERERNPIKLKKLVINAKSDEPTLKDKVLKTVDKFLTI